MSAHAKATLIPFRTPEQPAEGTASSTEPNGGLDRAAVCLEVPIRILGNRVIADPEAGICKGESFEEESTTLVLFPRGAVVRLAATVERSQELMLINKRTNKYVHCRVTNLRTSPDVKSYVEIEFTHTTSDFWGVSFPKEAVKAAAAACAQQIPSVSCTGSRGEGTGAVPPPPTNSPMGTVAIKEGTVVCPPAERNVTLAPSPPTSPAETEETTYGAPSFLPRAEVAVPVCEPVVAPGEAADGATTPTRNAPWPTPAASRGEAEEAQGEAAQAGSQLMKWESVSPPEPRRGRMRLVIAILAVLSVTVVGYLSFFAEPVMTISPFSDSSPIAESSEPAAKQTSAADSAREADTSPSSVVTVNDLAPDVAPTEAPKRFVVLVSKMNAPGPSTRVNTQDAPELGATVGEEPAKAAPQLSGEAPGKTPGLLGALGSPQPPPPEPAPVAEHSDKHEDSLLPARLVSSPPPSYPLLARQERVEGDVIIEAQIDASGKVTGMKVRSGPQLLRTAAVNALTRWKFEPARLGNQPTASTTTVTIHFRLN